MPPNDRLPASRLTEALRIDAASGIPIPSRRAIANEVPVSFIYGDAPYAVMMASPGDAEDFAYGFSLTEGIVRSASEIRSVRAAPQEKGLELHIELAPGRFREHLARRRALTGRTSCGLCGVETVEQLPQAERLGSAPPVAPRAIFAALANLDRNQQLNALTHAVHGAAFCTRDGAIRALREDVGRHNALDKLIGALIREGVSPREGFVVVTSRASFEMVEKTAIFGAPALVAISAPTSLAIERAQALGLSLAAIARADSMMVFSGALAADQAAGPEAAAS
ncbi:formate dehydrogenase accessory sulfurtransferase FdhD [Rhodoblastus acidophilus]|uniref:Sulfur carrier protein FdhD n=1 Tax=Candidatus Rhodoblastus alkanivorans TaxID=2954117 RepID=A0ABS9Z868_9HYPH|nr:formate dehydrogenase accessory sulfurtransferase FdhD [Candidatus Rhodoblastus alkanivorans]MCI4679702.1 formate dehydrogenase accessory sulfurtransferase FdhD [Candidatus Rhodoblastus alkanivorans]MCI4683236.1 formate dehydrogenase accessory sulfurtransferase FdhD [Candidatus Rhodoblastus alkanivorans]MDI4640548.1 formate dehydrogenase accessory sulfurtransferase FdhD [Rhodoblastus acidophilus]